MANNNSAATTRGLQQVWVPEQACWVFVWAMDDGDLDRNLRLVYSVVSSPSEFQPAAGQMILTKGATGSTYTYVYGVPYRMQVVSGVLKVYFTNLTSALGNPRWATTEPSPDSANVGKDPTKAGWCLEGQFSRESIDVGPILWNQKDQIIYNNPVGLLEVADLDIESQLTNNGPPGGVVCVQYQRNEAGQIVTDDNGVPQIAYIDDSLDPPLINTAQNFKIGYLGLNFFKDYYGIGLHAWLAAPAQLPGPFDLVHLDQVGQLLLQPGTVNQLLPDDPLEPLDCSSGPIAYVSLHCKTDGNQVNQVTYEVSNNPTTPAPAVRGSAPAEFFVALGFVVKYGENSYTYYPTWPRSSNVNAQPTPWITTDRDNAQPGQTLTEQWWSWSIIAATFIP